MKNTSYFIMLMATCTFLGCRREKDETPTANDGQRLVKTEHTSTGWSVVANYEYDQAGNLAYIKATERLYNGTPVYSEVGLMRNTQGIIEKMYKTNSALKIQSGIDSIIYRFGYDPAQARYRYRVGSASPAQSSEERDSTVFTYDQSNNIVKEELFLQKDNTPYKLVRTVAYDYSGSGNISKTTTVDDPGGQNEYTTVSNLTHDDKKSPYHFGLEGIVIDRSEFYSSNNMISFNMADPIAPYTLTYTYTYNSLNKPLTSVYKIGEESFTTNYYYQ